MRVQFWREKFAALNPKPVDLTLDRMRAAAARLGHPESAVSPHIHVSGTNGKGGVVVALESAFTQAGMRVQTYTSPYLWRFEENVRLNGAPIDADFCAGLFAKLWAQCADIPLTWFEADTLVAFLAFQAWQAEVTLVECGMGGGRDATAIAPRPTAAILTNVGGDHAEFLGTDLTKVAQEKAGIAKGGPLYAPADFPHCVGPAHQVVMDGAHPSLTLARAVLADLFPMVAPPKEMPPQIGRWTRNPQDPHTIYDVGHNAHAAHFLAGRLAQEPPPYLIEVGMLRRKDPRAFLEAFVHWQPFLSPIDLGAEGHAPADIASIGQDLGLRMWQGETVGTRLITGSHQTVAKLYSGPREA